MNIDTTLRRFSQQTRTVICAAIFIAIGGSSRIATAQVYEPDAVVSGKSIGDWAADFYLRNLNHEWTATQPDLIGQRGPVFFLSRTQPPGDWSFDVPFGAPIFVPFIMRSVWDYGLAENERIARQLPFSSETFQYDDFSLSRSELRKHLAVPSHPVLVNGDPNGAIAIYAVMLEPPTPGEHRIEWTYNLNGTSKGGTANITVIEPETANLVIGETYEQDFDGLGTDGESVKTLLPSAWTCTDEWGFIQQRHTDAEFPISSTPRPGAFPYVTNAGVPGEEDRALSIYMPRDTESRSLESDVSQLQFLADANGAANSLQVQFDIEAWDVSSSSRSADPGEAAFDMTIDIDSGNGFEPLLDLGHITTGELQKPEGDFLNGNDATNRVSFDSGILPVTIPSGSQLRFRWAAALDGNSDGWVFGLDNFAVTLLGDVAELVGDFNGDGSLGIDDLDTLTTAIRANGADSVYDLDGSGVVDLADRQHWVTDVKNTWIGDTNLDGVFDTSDMITAFSSGQYEDDIVGNSTWSTGDWNGDGEFNSGDLIEAFGAGGYEAGPRAAVAAVPEPASFAMLLVGLLGLSFRRR